MADNILSSSTFSKLPLNEQTKDATATAGNIFEGKTAYVNCDKITGTMLDRNTVGKNDAVGINESYSNVASNPCNSNIQMNTNLDGVKRLSIRASSGYYNGNAYVSADASLFGNAVTSNVLSGKTFTSENGLKLTGALSNFGSTTKASSTVAYDSTNNVIQITIPASGYYNTSSKITITKAQLLALTGLGLVDTSNATATAADIAKGKTAYINGGLVTGTNTKANANSVKISTSNNALTIEYNDRYYYGSKYPATVTVGDDFYVLDNASFIGSMTVESIQ